ncbi:hypothetical protein OG559_12955 [Micromonospora sp. NBC_01405]|uniref:nucleotide disphospho-sugar-binding domain-containing protein n=1 Tax=Micromonospora sp. NBC_01405 TaxID=2903589 RepID=UPI00324C34A3
MVPTFAAEQTVATRRVAATGSAVHMLGHHADPPAIRAAIEDILADQQYTAAAHKLRAEMSDQPTPAQFVTTLTELAG